MWRIILYPIHLRKQYSFLFLRKKIMLHILEINRIFGDYVRVINKSKVIKIIYHEKR